MKLNILLSRTVVMLLVSLFVSGCIQQRGVEQNAKENDEEAEPVVKVEAKKRPNLLKRKTQEVVHMQKAMEENPKLIEVENKVSGNDPLTTTLTGYIAASSKINVMNMQHQIDLMRAAEDRNPTYDEIMELIKQHNMQFNALPDYQMYAYNEEQGIFTILEDPQAKKEFYDQAK